ncbi:MAG: agmatine deiminase family protein [Chromatiales bacterium]|jgi:agmatine/peptidylarginine deiminase|nr:agmatine deiminase family protein [Chromatiales bacterium]MDX9767234.1 agmatine deiminase family protein [Ectothiorhodospiraceae bacterium]
MHRTLPPEWAPQRAVMLTWPHDQTDWADILDRVEPVYDRIAREVTAREELLVVARDEAHAAYLRQRLLHVGCPAGRVHVEVAPSNDTWARDHGPISVLEDGRARLLDFRFNGWGGKFAHDLDDAITGRLHAQGAFGDTPMESLDFILEGGSIESDGQGTLLTTRQCLLTPTRNPHCDERSIEELLKRSLGVERVLWLSHGHLEGDDTDSHIDTLARLCPNDTIAHVVCADESDPHHEPLAAMAAELADFRTADGRPYRLVPLPLPAPIRDPDGRRLGATHANFLIINGAVLVPTYDDPTDDVALERLATCFPDRDVIGIDCRPLIYQNGSLHCITMQLPQAVTLSV